MLALLLSSYVHESIKIFSLQIVMDWTMTLRLFNLEQFPLPIRMRSHILLEPPTKAGGAEKIFRIYEEWNGNAQLNEKTTAVPQVGRLHSRLRRFHGWLGAESVKAVRENFWEKK